MESQEKFPTLAKKYMAFDSAKWLLPYSKTNYWEFLIGPIPIGENSYVRKIIISTRNWLLLFRIRYLLCNLLLNDHVTLEQLKASIGSIFGAVFAILDAEKQELVGYERLISYGGFHYPQPMKADI